jgi:hypothetical protein
MTLEEFKNQLKESDNTEKRVRFLRKHMFHGLPAVFDKRESDYFDFRQFIGEKFDVGFQEVFIVGSGKLGFSYIKGTQFSYESDIDIVIVNEQLFEKYYQNICDYQYQLDRFKKIPTERELTMYNRFLQYLVKGWMRPDLLPYSFQADAIKSDWFEFFKSISYGQSNIGNYKVNGGLFKNYQYLEKYHLSGIEQTYNRLIA